MIARTLSGRYNLTLNLSMATWGEVVHILGDTLKTGLALEQNWGNGLGPIEIGTANFITE